MISEAPRVAAIRPSPSRRAVPALAKNRSTPCHPSSPLRAMPAREAVQCPCMPSLTSRESFHVIARPGRWRWEARGCRPGPYGPAGAQSEVLQVPEILQ